MMIRRLPRLLLASILPLFLAACQKPEAPAPDTVTLRLLMSSDATGVWREIFDEFEKAHPGIRIDAIEGPAATNTREDLHVTAFLSGDRVYDLVFADTVWIPKFAAAGWLLDLTDKWPDSQWERFLPGALAGSKYRGRIYRVPTQMDGGMLYYRRDLLEKAGEHPPETFDDLQRIATQLQEPRRLWGFVWQGKQYEGLICDFVEVLAGFGGFWIDPDSGEIGLDRPEARQALEFLAQSVGSISPPGVTTYTEEESRQVFESGGAVFLRNWPYVYPLSQAPDSPIRGLVGVTPMPHQGGGASASTLGGWGFGIAKNSPHPGEAWQLLQFLAQVPVAQRLYEKAGVNSTLEAFYRESNDSMVQELYQILRHTIPRPPIPQYAQASDILQRYLSSALTGRLTPGAALAGASRETRLLLGSQGKKTGARP